MVCDHGKLQRVNVISISRFKATCLAVLEEVRTTGRPVLVTRRGVPVAEVVPPTHQGPSPRRLGEAAGRLSLVGDIIEPAAAAADWEVLGDLRRPV